MPNANLIWRPDMPFPQTKRRAANGTGEYSQHNRRDLRLSSIDLTPVRIVLSVDPSITRAGYAVWDRAGRGLVCSGGFSPSDAAGRPNRHTQLAEHFATVMRTYGVQRLVIETSERPGYSGRRGMGTKQAMVFGRALGDIEGVAVALGVVVRPVDVREWKGTANKAATLALCRQYGANPQTLDESDAIGIGIWYLGKIHTTPAECREE